LPKQQVGVLRTNVLKRMGLSLEEADGLSLRELRFIGELCVSGLNHPGDAYIKSGFVVDSKREATAKAKELMADSKVRRVIEKFINKVLDPYRERIIFQLIQIMEKRALWNIKDFFNEDGSVKPLDQIPEDSLYAIDGIKEDWKGRDANRRVVSYTLADRKEAFEMVLKYLEKGETDTARLSDEAKTKLNRILEVAKASAASAVAGYKTGMKDRQKRRKQNENENK